MTRASLPKANPRKKGERKRNHARGDASSPRSLVDEIANVARPLQPVLVVGVAAKGVGSEDDAQELGESDCVFCAAEEGAGPAAEDAPLLDGVDGPLDDELLVAACEGGFLGVPDGLEGGDEVLERGVEADEDVDGPCEVCVGEEVSGVGGRVVGVVFEVVLEEELEDDVDGEDDLVHVDAAADLLDLERERFPGLRGPVEERLLVHLFD